MISYQILLLKQYPLYSLTIEDGITAKTDRYERSHLVKKENAYKIVRPNDFAYNPMNVRFGAVARHKGTIDVCVSGYYDIFTTKDKSDLEFMDSFLISDKMIAYYNKISIGSLVEKQRVHFSQFMEFRLPLPSSTERKKIAEILSAQDKLIALKEKLIEEKKRQKKYLMQQLLTGKKRLPGFSGEWESLKIGSLGLLKSGNGFPEKYQGVRSGSIPFFKVSDMNTDTNSVYLTTAQNYISNAIAQNIKINILPPKAIVFAKVGAAISLERKKILLQESAIDNNMMAYLPIKINDLFAYYWFLNTRLSDLTNVGALPSINANEIATLDIKLPPYNEQVAIAGLLTVSDRELELLNRDLDREKQKKKALMQLLLSGVVRVNV